MAFTVSYKNATARRPTARGVPGIEPVDSNQRESGSGLAAALRGTRRREYHTARFAALRPVRLDGVIAGDNVALVTAGATGAFASKGVGTDTTVTVSGLTLTGSDAANYTLTEPTTTANITAATLTVSGITANNKPYDGTNSATLNTAGATLAGVAPGDDVTLDSSGALATFVLRTSELARRSRSPD